MKKIIAFILATTLLLISVACNNNTAPPTQEPEGEFDMQEAVLQRFLSYVVHDTQSDDDSEATPSTAKQIDFAKILVEECKKIGLSDVELSPYGIVTATLPANTDEDTKVIGLIAHMDTAPDASGEGVVPLLHENYNGGDIVLPHGITISPNEFPELKNYIGQTIITASGDTLLGADDKAGIAIILTAMEYLLRNPEIPHGKIRIAFTPDEEIGRGTENFDIEAFGADFALTIDGGATGELEFENFNAARAVFEIHGKSVHPGYAKGIMINAALIASELVSEFPPGETPANTEGYEGFYHIMNIEGGVEKATVNVIIRSFDEDEFEARKKFAKDLAARFNEKYGEGTVVLSLNDQYFNMMEFVPDWVIELAKDAFSAAGVKPVIKPIRGGTDGAMLSNRGMPTPNIFTGGYNFHGPYEFAVLESMVKAVNVIINLSRK